MSDLGSLNVKIGADLSELFSKVDAGKAKLGQLKESAQELKAGINDLNASLRINESELSKSATALKKLVDSGKGASQEAQNLRNNISSLSAGSLELTKNLSTAKTELADTTTQLKLQSVALKEAERAGTGFGGAATKLYSGLRTIANILPGIGIGGLVALISGPLIDAFEDWYNAVNKVSAIQQLLKDVNADAAKGAADQVTTIDVLKNKLNDLTKPLSVRTELAKEYNKIADEGNKIDLTQLNNLAAINKQIDKQISLIERQALATAARSKIASFADKAIEAENNFQDALKQSGLTEAQVSASIDARMKQSADVAKKTQQSLDNFNSSSGKLKIVALDGSDALNQVQLVDKKLEALLLAKKNAAFQLEDIIKTLIPKISDDSFKTGGKSTFEAELAALEKSYEEKQKLRVKDLDANLQDSKRNGIVVNDILLADEIKFLNDKEDLLKKYNKRDLDNFKALQKAKQELIDRDAAFQHGENKDNVFQKIDNKPTPIEDIFKEAKDKIDKTIPKPELKDDVQKNLNDLINLEANEKVAAAFATDVLSPAFDSLFSSIENGGKDAFKNFIGSLGKAIEQLGFAIIKAIALKAITDSISGGAGIASGGGIPDFLSLLGFAKGGYVKGYATGGAINGPGTGTSDSILARLSKGEYVVKAATVSKLGVSFLDRLNSGSLPPTFKGLVPGFANGGFVSPNLLKLPSLTNTIDTSNIQAGSLSVPYIVGTSIRGNDLRIVMQRANASYHRNT